MKNNTGFCKSNKLNMLLAAFILLVINLGCNFSCGKFAETSSESGGEAELVREAHSIVEKANQTVSKANILQNELLSKDSLKGIEDFEKYNSDNKAKFDELIKLREDVAKSMEDAAAKFGKVSEMNTNDKFKEYNNTLAQLGRKGAELQKAGSAFVKSYLAEKDPEKLSTLFADHNKKDAELTKELDSIQEKAAKIKNDNPDIFKK
ncbi:MAG TPA: hypothetical protein PKY82_19015 [Pyrinomonadaceae bacterium]|nr:hypothetical protein [Pyrinomonadaceae bacterium]